MGAILSDDGRDWNRAGIGRVPAAAMQPLVRCDPERVGGIDPSPNRSAAMSETNPKAVATLGEVRISGSALPADGATIGEALVVLRPDPLGGFEQVRAYPGMALRAGDMLGAGAYAVGTEIQFKDAPSVHLAAHEATHVVQQRSVDPVNEAYFEAAKASARPPARTGP
jgi:hypothetical protein